MKSTFAIVTIVLGIILFGVANFISAANYGNRTEAALEAQHTANREALSNYTTRIGEAAQIPAMARDDLSRVIQDAFTGRYGPDGSQATVQLIVEAYPGQISPALYENIQTEIVAGRRDFSAEQRKLIDKLREYETSRGEVWKGFWIKLAGYPKKDLSKFNVVMSDASNRAFETGVDNGVTFRP